MANIFNEYPYKNYNDLNLDYILRKLLEMDSRLTEYVKQSTITFHDPITWDITDQYTINTMVIDKDGTAYLSVKAVPAGIDIINTDYWQPVFNYDDNINGVRASVASNERNSTTATSARSIGDLVYLNGVLYKITAPMNAGDAYVIDTNCVKYTVSDRIRDLQTLINNEASTRELADSQLQTNIDNEAKARESADTQLQTNINNEATTRESADSQLQTNINNETAARESADIALGKRIDDIDSIPSNILVYPSTNPLGLQREIADFVVPESVNKFVDNVLGIVNKSHGELSGVETWGNAAIAFFDSNFVERGAIGYSRENSIQPHGFINNTLYAEIGNPFGSSGTDTDFRVVATNSTNFPAGQFIPIEVISQTGATNIRARGVAGGIHLVGGPAGVGIGNIAENEIGRFTIDMTSSNCYMREYFTTNRFAINTNIFDDQLSRLNGDVPAWSISMGAPTGTGGISDTTNCVGKYGFQIDHMDTNNVRKTYLRISDDGHIFTGNYEVEPGFDGVLCVGNGTQNQATATFKSNTTIQPALLLYNKTNDENSVLMAFGTGTSYGQRGNITYSGGQIHYNTTSDYRVKTIEKEKTDSLELIKQINIYDGFINGSENKTSFVLAHELQSVFPECVTGEKDAYDENGNPILQQVDYSKLIPAIIGAIKELAKDERR